MERVSLLAKHFMNQWTNLNKLFRLHSPKYDPLFYDGLNVMILTQVFSIKGSNLMCLKESTSCVSELWRWGLIKMMILSILTSCSSKLRTQNSKSFAIEVQMLCRFKTFYIHLVLMIETPTYDANSGI